MSSLCVQPVRGAVAFAPKEMPALVFQRLSAVPRLAGVTPASRLEVRPALKMVSSGIREIDALRGGLPRGCLTEVCGTASSGRTSVLLAALTAATQRAETCALVDTSDAFDPVSGAAAGMKLERLLWVRCGGNPPRRHPSATLRAGSDTEKNEKIQDRVAQALRVTDLLLQSGGFGLVAMDFGDVPYKAARRIPLASWFRFQRAVENTPTVLFVVTPAPCAQTCAALLFRMQASVVSRRSSGEKLPAISDQRSEAGAFVSEVPTQAQLLEGFHVEGELLRSRLERKPVASVTTAFRTRAVRFG